MDTTTNGNLTQHCMATHHIHHGLYSLGLVWTNRELLNLLPPLAAKVLLKLAKNKRVKPGVFIALHTFGRDLKRNVHLHASITLGGINKELTQWKSLYFHQPTLMSMWRYEVINLFRGCCLYIM